MKLNDPFGRVSNRNQRNYQSLRDRLHQEGIRDASAVSTFTRNMTGTAVKLLLILFGVSLLAAAFLPQFRVVLIALNALALLWVGVVYFQARMHLKRYLREECDDA